MTSVLIVEDDQDLSDELADFLGGIGYSVTCCGSVSQAMAALVKPFDLLVLDINLPDGSGLELSRRLRPYIRSGIVMYTGRSEHDLRISSLKDGADAYLVKPVDPLELEATLVSVLRRLNLSHGSLLKQATLPVQWRLDVTRQTLTSPNAVELKLSAAECMALESILSAPQQATPRATLLRVLDIELSSTSAHRLEALVSRLRKKVLEKTGLQLPIQSMYGKGYTFSDHAIVIGTPSS